MKTNIKQNVKAIILGLIFTIGMGYALADWTPPKSTPPNCITVPTDPNYDAGCVAPINVGNSAQTKFGTLSLGGLGVVGNFTFLPSVGGTPTTGQVLMADDSDLTNGKVKWGTVAGGGNKFFANLRMYTGNNSNSLSVVGILEPGTYNFSGRIKTANDGGGGWASVYLSDSDNLTYDNIKTVLDGRFTEPTTGATGPSYTSYYYNNATNSDLIFALKRNGNNDNNFVIGSTSVTVTSRKYVYLMGNQVLINGYILAN